MQARRVRRALLGAVAGLTLPAAPAHAAALIVDDNGTDCPGAPFTSIQAAVDAAAAGDTIAVCPGVYLEGDGGTRGLVVAKDLAIRGTGADEVFIQPDGGPDKSIFADPAGDPAGPPLRDDVGNIVSVTGAAVDISGVTVQGGDVAVETGIAYLNATGTISNVRVTDIVQSAATNGPGRFGIFQRGLGIVAFSTVAAGDFPLAIANTEISGYNKGGVVVDSAPAATFARSGSHVVATITDSVVQGGGPQGAAGIGQNAIQVSWGAAAAISRSTLANNFFVPDPTSGVGLLMVDADTARTSVTASNIQGNSFGVVNVDATFADSAATAGVVDATGNWWGNQNGPGRDGPEVDRGDPVTVTTVAFEPFATEPFPERGAAGPPVDAAPTVRITAPANGDALQAFAPQPLTVAATAADDIAVQRVVFRAGTTVIGVDATPPYTARYAPAATLAGTTQVITATALDHSGQSSVDAVSVRIAAAAVAGASATATADRPPNVLFDAPDDGAVLRGGTTRTLEANATDDRGVARVTFFEDGHTLCSDPAPPYRCAFRPGLADVGRNALTAVATDTAGQTAAASRAVQVGRFRPRRLTARTTPVRDRTRPWRFRTTGTLAPPRGVTRGQACSTGVVSVRVQRGRSAISSRRVRLRADCTYTSTVQFGIRRRVGRTGRLTVSARFLGNARLSGVEAPARRIRAG